MPCTQCGDTSHNKSSCKKILDSEVHKVELEIEQEILEKLRFLARCCQEVARELGKGHTEKVYQEALSIELQKNNIFHIMEQTLPIMYKGYQIGGNHSIRLDICLMNYLDFIYELKATNTSVRQSELWQILRYLKIKGYEYGAVVNFNQSQTGKLEIQFVVKVDEDYYIYDFVKKEGVLLNDYALESEVDFSPKILERDEDCLIQDTP
jgi:GxxExxY protein